MDRLANDLAKPRNLAKPLALPHGWGDVLRQLLLFAAAYAGYQLVRGLTSTSGERPSQDASRIINMERSLHVFIEPSVQHFVSRLPWLMDFCDWTYLNAHFVLTLAVLVFIYLRCNDSFYFVRNMFMVAMALALVGYALFPTAPPRLMPQYGFTDPLAQLTGTSGQHGLAAVFVNPYAAVPSMHVCFALMASGAMVRLAKHRLVKIAWSLYPILITFVVIVTGNHYLTDVCLGAVTAGAAGLISKHLLARQRPEVWAFAGAPA